jgi:hypothetical protein
LFPSALASAFWIYSPSGRAEFIGALHSGKSLENFCSQIKKREEKNKDPATEAES